MLFLHVPSENPASDYVGSPAPESLLAANRAIKQDFYGPFYIGATINLVETFRIFRFLGLAH